MPFPASEYAGAKLNLSVSEDGSKSYAFTVFGSRSLSSLLKTGFQKNANQYLSGERLSFEQAESRVNFCLPLAQKRHEADFRHAALFADSQSDRAPPSV